MKIALDILIAWKFTFVIEDSMTKMSFHAENAIFRRKSKMEIISWNSPTVFWR